MNYNYDPAPTPSTPLGDNVSSPLVHYDHDNGFGRTTDLGDLLSAAVVDDFRGKSLNTETLIELGRYGITIQQIRHMSVLFSQMAFFNAAAETDEIEESIRETPEPKTEEVPW